MPRSIQSQDLDCGRRFITENLVLDLRPCEAPLASRSIRRSRLPSCLYSSDGVERSVRAIVPAKDDLLDLDVSAFDREPYLFDVFLPSPPLGLNFRAGIGGLERLLAHHKPLVSGSGAAHSPQ